MWFIYFFKQLLFFILIYFTFIIFLFTEHLLGVLDRDVYPSLCHQIPTRTPRGPQQHGPHFSVGAMLGSCGDGGILCGSRQKVVLFWWVPAFPHLIAVHYMVTWVSGMAAPQCSKLLCGWIVGRVSACLVPYAHCGLVMGREGGKVICQRPFCIWTVWHHVVHARCSREEYKQIHAA